MLRVFTFSNSLVDVPGRRGFALRDVITSSQLHAGTELGKAVRSRPTRVGLIVITDEQSHDLVPKMKASIHQRVAVMAHHPVGMGATVG
jgi:60 kDa SS-A/Ro ribonucleoprotein